MSLKVKKSQHDFGSVKNQYLATFVANIICFTFGTFLGWVSPAIVILTSDDTPLASGPINHVQISWIGSVNALVSILGTFSFGFITVWIGAKNTLVLLSLPATLYWILIYFGNTYEIILLARFFSGIVTGGLISSIMLYTSEISNNSIRGKLCSFSYLIRNIGILVAYILGSKLNYKTVPCVLGIFPVIFGIWFYFLPNTPQYYLNRGQIKKADEALRYYKGCKGKTIEGADPLLTELERLKAISDKQTNDEKVTFSDFFNRKAMKQIFICVVLASLEQFSGIFIIITYGVWMFNTIGLSHIDPFTSSVTIAICKIVGTLITTQLSDSLGRKLLFIYSFLASGFGLLSFGMYCYMKQNGYDLSAYDWLPVATLSFVIFATSAGVVPLYSICAVETLSSKIRTIGLSISNTFLNISAFTSLKFFPILSASIGLHGCMFILGVACCFGALFILVVLKETKGKALDTVNVNGNAQKV